MTYPTLDEVNSASRMQICRWYRFLPSPGKNHIGKPDFDERTESELQILARIMNRLNELGGFTAEISKAIGW